MRKPVLLLAMGAFLASAPALAAQPAAGSVEDRGVDDSGVAESTPEAWYGWQTLLIDSAAIGAGALAFATGEDAGVAPSLPAYVLGAPIVHLLHERPAAALVSGATRLALPLGLGFAFGGQPECGDDPACFSDGFMIGAAVGAAASVALDAALLSWQPAEDAPQSYMVPAVLVGNGTYGIALSGSL